MHLAGYCACESAVISLMCLRVYVSYDDAVGDKGIIRDAVGVQKVHAPFCGGYTLFVVDDLV